MKKFLVILLSLLLALLLASCGESEEKDDADVDDAVEENAEVDDFSPLDPFGKPEDEQVSGEPNEGIKEKEETPTPETPETPESPAEPEVPA